MHTDNEENNTGNKANGFTRTAAGIALLIVACTTAMATDGINMLGRQSQNEGMWVLPAPGDVIIDGDLSDWDWSGRIWCFADIGVRDEFSVEVGAMWDKDNLYVAMKWKDPTPMNSRTHPGAEAVYCWQADSVFMHIRTDTIRKIVTWHYAPEELNAALVYWCAGRDDPSPRKGDTYYNEAGMLEHGIETAYRRDAGGKGYVQEIKLPWSLIYDKPPLVVPGMRFQVMFGFYWGDRSGNAYYIHRYADNLQPGATHRDDIWNAYEAWGDAVLLGAGDVPVRRYAEGVDRPGGVVPVRATIPRDATRFTIAVKNEAGESVRSLAADFDPEEYTVAVEGDERTVEVMWDCLDDDGKLLEPGLYSVKGLTHRGLGALYEMSFYNPGTPPWQTKDGTGGWGADYYSPSDVAASGDWAFVSYGSVALGDGIMGIGPDGRKKWGMKKNPKFIAADRNYVYGVCGLTLYRFAKSDGSYKFMRIPGEDRTWPWLKDMLGQRYRGKALGIAACNGKVVFVLSSNELAVLNTEPIQLEKRIKVRWPTAAAFDKDGNLYVLSAGKLNKLDLDTGRLAEVTPVDFGKSCSIATDTDGNILVMDSGLDCRIKAFTPKGEPAYTVGMKGGRPRSGPFRKEGLLPMARIAVDGKDQIWVAEFWLFPRRVSVWGQDGKLIRDYIGCTGYAAAGTYLHDQDPTLAYVGPTEIKLDHDKHTWDIAQILWVPDEEAGERFRVDPSGADNAQRFTGDVGFGPREYMYSHHNSTHVVYMERKGRWQPVAAVGPVIGFSGKKSPYGRISQQPTGGFKGMDINQPLFWYDRNGNGIAERNECELADGNIPLHSGWGGRISNELVIYCSDAHNGVVAYKPIAITPDGAPMYGPAGMQKIGAKATRDIVRVPDEGLLLSLGHTATQGIDEKTGKVLWSYPDRHSGVHGSHYAPMPKPGLMIGTLKICGVAKVDDRVGNVFLVRGNQGEDYFLTTDGLFVGALFEDSRFPNRPLPDSEDEMRGKDLANWTNGDEPFLGWFGKQSNGKIRMTRGFEDNMLVVIAEVTGLEAIRRFRAPDIELDAVALVEADQRRIAHEAARKDKKTYIIRRLAQPPAIDGKPDEWRDVLPMKMTKPVWPENAHAKLAWDDDNLYAFFEVADASPWQNAGDDHAMLFKTGDALDLQLSAVPALDRKQEEAGAGDMRIVLSPLEGKPVAVLMKPIDPNAPAAARREYKTADRTKSFDRVEILDGVRIAAVIDGDHYFVEVAVPLKAIGLKAAPGIMIPGDVGLISSDPAGRRNIARAYWANDDTDAVDDPAAEAWLYPAKWGKMIFE